VPEEGDLQRSDYTTTVVLAGSEHRKPERPIAEARAQRLSAPSERRTSGPAQPAAPAAANGGYTSRQARPSGRCMS